MAEQPLVESLSTITELVISQVCGCVSNLANLLPTGTVTVFQLVAPVLTNQGQCDYVNRSLVIVLITLCAIYGFVVTFTDSFTDSQGVVRYGFATLRGLSIINGGTNSSPPLPMETYRLKFIDFFHAFLSLVVFATVALCDTNTVACFYPFSYQDKGILKSLPVTIGIIACIMFTIFPTKRQEIGFSVSDSSS